MHACMDPSVRVSCIPYSGKIWRALNLAKRPKISFFPNWRIFNLAKLSQKFCASNAKCLVSRSQLDSHARSESGYARLLREVSHGSALLQVSSRHDGMAV